METQKSYRKWGTRDCPISLTHYHVGMTRMPYHWHPEMEILYVKEGQLNYLVEEQPIFLSTGDILILTPEQAHQIASCSPDVDVRRLTFSLDALELADHHVFQKEFVQPLRNGLLAVPQVLHAEHPAHKRIYQILVELHTPPVYTPGYRVFFYGSVVYLCALLRPWCEKKADILPEIHIKNATVHKAIMYLHNNYARPVTLNMVAKQVHLNPSYLSTLIKQETGMSFLQYLRRVRIEAATFLLRRDDLSMSEVAEKAGFGSEAMFYRKFKAVMGMTPKAYQKQQTNRADREE